MRSASTSCCTDRPLEGWVPIPNHFPIPKLSSHIQCIFPLHKLPYQAQTTFPNSNYLTKPKLPYQTQTTLPYPNYLTIPKLSYQTQTTLRNPNCIPSSKISFQSRILEFRPRTHSMQTQPRVRVENCLEIVGFLRVTCVKKSQLRNLILETHKIVSWH